MKTLRLLLNLDFLKQWKPLRRTLFFSIVIISAIYCFMMWTFSSRVPWNYVTIVISIAIVLLVIIYNSFFTHIKCSYFVILIVSLIITALVSYVFNIRDSSFPKSLLLVYLLALFIYQFVSNDEFHLKWFIYSVFIGTLIFAIYYVIYYFPNLINFQSFTRLGNKFDNQNSVAMSFVILGLFSFYMVISKRVWHFIPLPFLMLYLCLSTGSISNTLCFMISIFIMSIIYSNKKGKIIAIGATIVSILLIIFLLQLPFASYFKNRIDNMINTFFGTGGSIDYSSAFRFDYAVTGFKLFLDKPLFGNGYGSVSLFTYGKGTFSHNNIAELLSNFGIVGFAIFEALLIVPFLKSNTSRKRMGLISVMLFIFIFQLFLVIFYLKIVAYLIPLFWGLSKHNPLFCVSFQKEERKIKITIKKTRHTVLKSKERYYCINI